MHGKSTRYEAFTSTKIVANWSNPSSTSEICPSTVYQPCFKRIQGNFWTDKQLCVLQGHFSWIQAAAPSLCSIAGQFNPLNSHCSVLTSFQEPSELPKSGCAIQWTIHQPFSISERCLLKHKNSLLLYYFIFSSVIVDVFFLNYSMGIREASNGI